MDVAQLHRPDVTNPAADAFAITPSNSAGDNFTLTRGFYVGAAGNVAVVLESGTAVTFPNMLAGVVYPIRCVRINSTNTTASSIVGLR